MSSKYFAKTNSSYLFSLTKVLLVVQMVFLPLKSFSAPESSTFWETDRKEHAGFSAAITTGTYVYLRGRNVPRWEALMRGIATTMIIGFAKEAFDPRIDQDDLRADAIGSVGAGVLVITIDFVAF